MRAKRIKDQVPRHVAAWDEKAASDTAGLIGGKHPLEDFLKWKRNRKMNNYKEEKRKTFMLRTIPEHVHRELAHRALDAGMSMNDYILRVLQEHLEREPEADRDKR